MVNRVFRSLDDPVELGLTVNYRFNARGKLLNWVNNSIEQ